MIGLALSGGGFRATLFHMGSLWRLNEFGILKNIKEISSVSGGSIISAFLGLKWNELHFDEHNVAINFIEKIVDPITDFCGRTIDVGTIIAGIISPIRHPSELLIKKYCKYLFRDSTLQDLPVTKTGPRFTIYSTSMQTGASVRFTRDYLGEYHLGKIMNPDLLLALAVAASSAFPPPLCPVKLKLKAESWMRSDISNLYGDENLKSTMWLVDGGVYDNLGLERIVKNCTEVLVSDAGTPFSTQCKMYAVRISQIARTKRTLDIMSEQVRALRTQNLVNQYISGKISGAYWGIGTKIEEYPLEKKNLAPALVKDSATTQKIARMRTRLDKFNKKEQGELINWGYALADAALRSRYNEKLKAAVKLPVPNCPI